MDAESLFLRFRATREPACLGEVFDLVAGDLHRVAVHVARDAAEADDLVQATFLVAIERAAAWDAGLPLRPWLLGILQREARDRRRRARRAPDPRRLVERDAAPPEQAALANETRGEVAAAIARVPQPYRDVLELRLVQALGNGEIAARLARSPGAVRTQLWRGLELLRALLPKGLALGAAAALAPREGMAAVRERVLQAAARRATTTTIAGGALAGGLLVHKLWLAVLPLLAVVLAGAWVLLPPRDVPAVPAAAAGPVPAVAAAARGERPPREAADTAQRTAVVPAASVASGEPPATALEPVVVDALVVDTAGDPVPDAEVAIHEPLRKEGEPSSIARARRPGPPRWRGRSDATGRCTIAIDGECFVEASKDGVGRSGAVRVWRSMLHADWRIVLLPIVRVKGVVLQPDGSPAAGVEVTGHFTTSLYQHLASDLVPTRTDDAGRFAFDAYPELDLRLMAHGKQRWARAYVETGQQREVEVVMQFPGAYSVRGRLLDAAGNGIAGEVRLLSRERTDREAPYHLARAAADGTFAVLLTEGGSSWLGGGVRGTTSAYTELTLAAARPHAAATLRVTPFVTLAGRVTDPDGAPRAGVVVGCFYDGERDALLEARLNLHGDLQRGPTAADGSFRWQVPAGFRYRLHARVTPQRGVRGPVVDVPAEDVTWVLTEAEMAELPGFTIAGRVVDAATDAVVPAFEVEEIGFSADGRGAASHRVARSTDGTFAVGPLPPGRRVVFVVHADGFAPGELGPFDTTVRHEDVVARLVPPGTLVVRVLRADGTPAVEAHVGLERAGEHPFTRVHQGATDTGGSIRFAGVAPDDYTVHAAAAVAVDGHRGKAPVVVRSGQEAIVTVTLD